MKKLNPENYVKILNLKEDVLTAHYFEVMLRRDLRRFNLPNTELIYLDGQLHYNKKDIKKYNFSNKKMWDIIKLLKKLIKPHLEFCVKIREKDFSELKWSELIDYFKKFIRLMGEAFAVADVPVCFEHSFEKKVIQKLKENGFKEGDFDILSVPLYESFYKRRCMDFIRLKLGEINKDKFLKEWDWSNTCVFRYIPVDDKFIDKSLKEIKNPKKEREEIIQKHKEEKKKFNNLYKKLPSELKKDADLMQGLIEIRDYRYEMIVKGCYYALNLLRELAKRMRISYNELVNMTPNEIYKKKKSADIKKRLKGFACVEDKIYTGKELKKLWNLFNKKLKKDFVKGNPASKGIVKGRAKIILKTEELNRLKKGDVLICEQTTPDYISGIKKAAAIVTNIGGLTCHAAIVSREFGIPAVVGAGNATLVFKDNDLVEVDANKGIIRKLK